MQAILDRSRGCLVGLAIGDAIGTTLEFKPRGSFKPLTDMVGGGHFCLKKGYWTDDTSMALCLGHSLIHCAGFDAHDQMSRYCDWLDNGYMSSIGTCFDVGVTVSSALRRFQKSGDPFAGAKSKWSSGNGSLMRLAPIPMAYAHDRDQAIEFAAESSRTTHASVLCLDSCRYLSALLVELISGTPKEALWQTAPDIDTPEVAALTHGQWRHKSYEELTGSGYVIESLEAALWCFYHTHNFADCVLAAANLGNDADTTAAIAGQLAGACYGYQAIRESWRAVLHRHEEIVALADQLFFLSQQLATHSEAS